MVCKGIAGISNYLILTALTHTLWEISRTKSIKLNTAHMLFIKFEKKAQGGHENNGWNPID